MCILGNNCIEQARVRQKWSSEVSVTAFNKLQAAHLHDDAREHVMKRPAASKSSPMKRPASMSASPSISASPAATSIGQDDGDDDIDIVTLLEDIKKTVHHRRYDMTSYVRWSACVHLGLNLFICLITGE